MFFGETLSSAQLVELARDVRLELRAAGGTSPELDPVAARVEKAARDLRLVFGEAGARLAWSQALRLPGFADALAKLNSTLHVLEQALAAQQGRAEGLDACARRASAARHLLVRLRETEVSAEVRWVEVFSHAVQLHVTPLSSAELFRRQMADHPRAWIFTSATLAVGEDFGHFTRELGVTEARTRRWASPFDFPRQALLYVPKALPEPGEAGFTEAVIEAALPVLRASEGRAFLLFTTLRALRRAHELLVDRIPYPLLVQGTGSRSQLLSRFRALGNAVLLGSQSFWEGVDVRGDALSLVVIDKLPFAPPDDPVLAARIEGVRNAGGQPFNELQLPQAVLQLKQGAGRLIRDEADRGVLMLCDPRLVTRAYGRRILQSLPPMALTRELSAVERFFAARPAGGCG
jgi:ATP-dependent DNA helicase DinG